MRLQLSPLLLLLLPTFSLHIEANLAVTITRGAGIDPPTKHGATPNKVYASVDGTKVDAIVEDMWAKEKRSYAHYIYLVSSDGNGSVLLHAGQKIPQDFLGRLSSPNKITIHVMKLTILLPSYSASVYSDIDSPGSPAINADMVYRHTFIPLSKAAMHPIVTIADQRRNCQTLGRELKVDMVCAYYYLEADASNVKGGAAILVGTNRYRDLRTYFQSLSIGSISSIWHGSQEISGNRDATEIATDSGEITIFYHPTNIIAHD